MTEVDTLSPSFTGHEFSARNYSSFDIAKFCAEVAALVLVALDHLTTLKFEWKSIWRIHYTLVHTHLAKPPVSPKACRIWVVGLLVSANTILLALDAVLVLRIYALYQKQKWVFFTLIPIFAQSLVAIPWMIHVLDKENGLDGMCNINASIGSSIAVCCTILITHFILWLATFIQRNVALGHAAIVRLVVIESTWALALMFVAALVLLCLDHLATLKFEWKSVWRGPFGIVNNLYLVSRYTAIISLIIHNILIHTHLAKPPVSPKACRIWISSLLVSSNTILLALDSVLFLRIYALYQKRKWVFFILIPIFGQIIASIPSFIHINAEKNGMDGMCNIDGSISNSIAVCCTILVTHIIIWLATFVQRNIALGHAAVVRLVVIESTWALAIVFALMAAIAPYSSIPERVSHFYSLAWSIALLSIMSCRLIINIRGLKVEPRTQQRLNTDAAYVLTTIVAPELTPNLDSGSNLCPHDSDKENRSP
ncbi:hypothetical protein CVT24_012935 [Panaeolus cyanescens]|uniref:DUF6533 domain-containing protein n=1 Tax=Panaeolus cyanescens TaxID=181874 RepID=A0A409W6H4_9AGAR|nr:hypothetical protein CVT24_012935 [Panaeolus cyanescens]